MESFYGTRDFVALYIAPQSSSTLGWAAIDTLLGHHGSSMLGALRGDHGGRGRLRDVLPPSRDPPVLRAPRADVAAGGDLPGPTMPINCSHSPPAGSRWPRTSPGRRTAISSNTSTCVGRGSPGRRVTRPRLRLITPEPREKPTTRSTGPHLVTEPRDRLSSPRRRPCSPRSCLTPELDEVLAKIAREGRGGLTEEENRVLQEASRRARNRRSDRI